MRPVGEMISTRLGWEVHALLLPGHGTTESDLNQYHRQDWVDAVDQKLHSLCETYPKVHLVGLSMGALLCLKAFQNNRTRVGSMALLAPAVFLRPFLYRLGLPVLAKSGFHHLVGSVPKGGPPLHPDHVTYKWYPLRAAVEFYKLVKEIQALKPTRSPPTFLSYSETDEVVDRKSADFLKEQLSHPLNRVFQLNESIHVITLGQERKRLFLSLEEFYREVIKFKK